MYRIVRTSTYTTLLADRAALGQARTDLATVTDARDQALTDLAKDRATGQSLLRQLAQAHADIIAADTGMQALVKQITAERDAAREEAGALADVRQDLARLRDHAADPANSGVRGAIAYGVLRDLITRARHEQAQVGQDGSLPRPFDVVALVLGLDDDQADAEGSAPVRVDAH
ncbi:hypothetical protein [Streptomyces globosus]|uniref:hypothetical protein n=1 Tax=Streptomyces globosus TaxID=68209 RepID=UPI0031E36C87